MYSWLCFSRRRNAESICLVYVFLITILFPLLTVTLPVCFVRLCVAQCHLSSYHPRPYLIVSSFLTSINLFLMICYLSAFPFCLSFLPSYLTFFSPTLLLL